MTLPPQISVLKMRIFFVEYVADVLFCWLDTQYYDDLKLLETYENR
jgi:hypothetical protein